MHNLMYGRSAVEIRLPLYFFVDVLGLDTFFCLYLVSSFFFVGWYLIYLQLIAILWGADVNLHLLLNNGLSASGRLCN